MLPLSFLLLLSAQVPVVEAPAYPRGVQERAVVGTVRVKNVTRGTAGSGAVVAVQAPYVFVLTAEHVVAGADEIEVAVFTPASYPRPEHRFRAVAVVARSPGVRDLALLRVRPLDPVPAVLPLAPAAAVPRPPFSALTAGCTEGGPPTGQLEAIAAARRVRRQVKGEVGYCWELERPQPAGRSGGPLLDPQGRVLGICIGNNRGRGYFCHVEEVERFLTQNGFRWLLDGPKDQ